MEIDNRVLALVFAPYMGVGCEYKWNREDDLLHGNITPKIIESLYYDDGVVTYCAAKLKPLSAISDEDAIEVAQMKGINLVASDPYPRASTAEQTLEDFKKSLFRYLKHLSAITADVYQLLQSRGYDLPSWHLGGKTLKECNLCTYEVLEGFKK